MIRMFRSCLLATVVVLLAAAPVFGQVQRSVTAAPDQLRERAFAAFEKDEHAKAAELLEQYLEARPNDHMVLYNLACARALLGEQDESASTLLRAVQAGFRSFGHMQRDPDLSSIRDHPTYLAIVEAIDRVRSEDGENQIQRWKNRFPGSDYFFEIDQKHRVTFATVLDRRAHVEMREMLEREAEHLLKTLFDGPPDDYVLIAVPTPAHVDELLKGDASVGGAYDHDQRLLVTRDIGASLRHEFFHVMHYGDMERRGQRHPLWVQEGLASLYEDYEFNDEGIIRFLANERHNVIQRRAESNRLMRWEQLMRLTDQQFMRQAGALYPQTRSMFEYIAAEGKLEAWYDALVAKFGEDERGGKAFETAFGKSLKEIERDWRRWLIRQPPIDNVIDPGDASLGIEGARVGAGDGVRITRILAGGAAALTTLRAGDIIVAIDERPTRSIIELQNVIGGRRVGDMVEVRVRRDEEYFTQRVTLRALSPPRMVP